MEQSDRSSDSGEYDEHIEALAPDEDLFEYYDDDVIFAASDAPDDDASDALQWVVSAHGQEKIQAMKEKMVKRPKKDSVLVKHKKWLAELQRNKERAEEEFLDEM
ncbi:MAG: hypothetical protein ACPIOQ_55140, partial [Promethearchaeia archaeon]